ncbi:putative Cellulose-binding, family II [Pseudorhizobium banfieldiae]|uniref:Putative Cellulose-binding, family II n=1 Tax=Pseudorhizobium banfieldiae TaxID=1125847 RepID=L0NIC7_9HYPH|nr:acyltransferase [arsenite-oxidising bacterium NT-25]CCF20858.1 putative Cellulose-binding, family II [Pseudorhizobium banfieldiae]
MFYHLLYGEQIVAIERIAYYFVYAFFIISGFSLYITYVNRLINMSDVRAYAVKRFRRIAPLFYLACLLQMLLVDSPNWKTVMLNMSLMFGFANPDSSSMVMGGWSIGIEMAFYVAFPVIVILTNRKLVLLSTVATASIILMAIFLNSTLSGQEQMTSELWRAYTQPIAFWGYFAFGCLLGEAYLRYRQALKGHWLWFPMIGLSAVPFFFVQVDNDISLLTGWEGALLMSSTLLMISSVAFAKEPSGHTLWVAQWLGRLSYPIYLLHPIMYLGIVSPLVKDNPSLRIGLTVITTLAFSTLVHHIIERRLGGSARLPAST